MKNKKTFKDGDYVKASSGILKNLAIYAADKGVPVTSFVDENTLCWQKRPENKLYSLVCPSIQTSNPITIDQFYEYCDNYHEAKVEPIAVKVNTQKQWDFVSEQLGYKWKTNWFGAERGQVQFISLENKCRYSPIKSFDPGELLTFKEWVKENGFESEWERYNRPKFKAGKWYICDKWEYIFRVREVYDTYITCDNSNRVEKEDIIRNVDVNFNSRHATNKEIKEHLLKLRDEKGYKIGAEYLCADSGREAVVGNNSFAGSDLCDVSSLTWKYHEDLDMLTDGRGGAVYYKGKWAKIISQPEDKPEFKEGDYVTITKSGRNWAPGMDEWDGRVVKITYVKISGSGRTEMEFYGSEPYFFIYEDGHFRHATPEEIKAAKGEDGITLSNGVRVKKISNGFATICDVIVSQKSFRSSLMKLEEGILSTSKSSRDISFDDITFNERSFSLDDIDDLIRFFDYE